MRPLGTIVNFSPKGSIVVRSEITPAIGQVVCDNRGIPIGKVIRVTGPVSRPYIMVSPMAKDEVQMFRMGGKKVFLDDRPKPLIRKERRERPEAQRPSYGRDGGGRPRDRPKGSRDFKVKGKAEGKYKKNVRSGAPSSRDRRKKPRK